MWALNLQGVRLFLVDAVRDFSVRDSEPDKLPGVRVSECELRDQVPDGVEGSKEQFGGVRGADERKVRVFNLWK